MLQFLVKSKARRLLLALVWVEEVRGSVSTLAEEAGLAFATAHSELKEMLQYELVRVEREGRCDVYFANVAHPQAELLKALLLGARSTPARTKTDETAKSWLKDLGVPLIAADSSNPAPSPSEVLAIGLRLARKDPTLARALPLGFWAQRDRLDIPSCSESRSSKDTGDIDVSAVTRICDAS